MGQTTCLITPPSPFLLDERVFVSLGILRVAASLEAQGCVVEHLDLNGVQGFESAVRERVARSEASAFGITATTPQMPAAVKVANAIYAARPGARIILGGPHVTLVNAARKRGNERAEWAFVKLGAIFDVLVAGDGEDAVMLALAPDAPALIDADDPKSPLWLTNKRLDELPFPARHLVDLHSYRYTIDGVPATSMIAQLGCPFECAFCGGRFSPMLRRIRTRTSASVVREIQELHDRFGFRGIMLYDDELNVNKELVPLMGQIAGLGYDLKLRGFIKAELFTPEQAAAMYRAGFRWILVGFESGSPRILSNINKKATVEENTRCLRIAHEHGLKVKALMSLGHAGESAETIQETKDWLLTERPDDFDATVITTYPGTPYFDEAVHAGGDVWTYTSPKSGDRLHERDIDFMHAAGFYKGIPGSYQAFVFTDHLSADELVCLRDSLESAVRARLKIPFNAGQPGLRYEASMGQMPGDILRCT